MKEEATSQSIMLISAISIKPTLTVNEEAGLSPGKYTQKYAAKQMKQRLRIEERSKLPSTKKRRVQLKQERNVTQCAFQALEGDTYESEIGLADEVDIEQIPDPVPRGVFKPVTLSTGDPSLVMFDLETTDLIRGRQMPHITQLAALELKTGSVYNTYILPKVPITEEAMNTTGIVVNSDLDKMTVHGKEVDAVNITSALTDFLTWFKVFQDVVLVAHNGRKFDFLVLMSTLHTSSLKMTTMLFSTVSGFIDSLGVFKKVFSGQPNYKQETLVKTVLNTTYNAHDATEDVKTLGMLIKQANLSDSQILQFSFPPISVLHSVHSAMRNRKILLHYMF
ncbi:uncharacterized protein LOC134277168 [Saccostrea cucullata]|uniref:uncharacterized protein LOC134277168 n=1 Tax=Saccostrea cuccullata TaxID=36930 RepID=UPI002ED3FCF1